MIPKSKLAILIAGLGKPRDREEDDEEDVKEAPEEGGDLKERCDSIAEGILDAVKEDSKDALCEALLDLVHLIQEEDAKQDEGEDAEED